jgi:hypothetical protein
MPKKTPKNPKIFSCENCDYSSSNKKDYNRHLMTRKHLLLTSFNDFEPKKTPTFVCKVCSKLYNSKVGLWYHNKKCNIESEISLNVNSSGIDYNSLILNLVNENNELKNAIINENKEWRKTVIDMIPKVGNINNINNTVNNNQKININVFLNEKCKDAISMDDFIKQIEINVKDLLITKDKGLIEGVSNIFIENMNKLSLYERPMHCTDTKRETLYIKQNDWIKDNDKTIIKAAVKKIASKQARSVNKWKDENPDFLSIDKKKDEFIKIVQKTTDDVSDKEDKIIKNICKDVHISESSLATIQ